MQACVVLVNPPNVTVPGIAARDRMMRYRREKDVDSNSSRKVRRQLKKSRRHEGS